MLDTEHTPQENYYLFACPFIVKAAAAGYGQVALLRFRITLNSLVVAFIGMVLM